SPGSAHLPATKPESTPSAPSPPSTPFPAVERDSGQKAGEDIHAFMERRRLHNEKRAQHESFDARKARLAREQHASGGTAPGKKGARVFIWEEEDALAPTEIAEPDNFDDDDGDDDFFFHQPPASTDVLPPAPRQTGERAAEVLEHAYGLTREDLCEDPSRLPGWNIQDARSIITSRFGFVENSTVPASSRKMQDKACGWGSWRRDLECSSESGLPALFQHILDANDLKSVSANLMDIASSDSDLENDWNIDVKMLRMQDRILYELFPRGLSFLESVNSAGKCCLLSWLAKTLEYAPLPPPIQPTWVVVTPAILRLWLTMEYVLKSGVRVEAARDGDTILWHETLTQDEVDIICGVYIVETGQKSSATEGGQQLKYISWWPTPTAFWSSGLNTGWWNSNCERWFVKRLRDMESHVCQAFHICGSGKIRSDTTPSRARWGMKNDKLAEVGYLAAHNRVVH
ncbi:hypothetical protein R3P38DRAFT_2793470, partial [Favolaschia claudopus]